MDLILIHFVVLPIVLAIGYIPAIQHERGGLWLVFAVIAIPLWILDIYLNYTVFSVYTMDFPRKGEYTFSNRLKRLALKPGYVGYLCSGISRYLNFFDPQKDHI